MVRMMKMAPFGNDSSMLLKWETSLQHIKKLRISEEGNDSLSVMRSIY